MPKLADTQTILLSTGSQRQSGNVLSPPEALENGGARLTKALAALLHCDLIEERETSEPAFDPREDGDLRFGLFITAAGLSVIGVEMSGGASEPPQHAEPPAAAPRLIKAAAVVALLERSDGAAIPQLIAATGWLPHTTRAALTGLRKKGHAIEKIRRDGATCYRIGAGA